MPLFRRFGRPGLLGAVARTAVVAGTSTMIARAVGRGVDGLRTRADDPSDGHAAGAARTAPAESVTSQLATLSSLRQAGAISDDEFTRAKQQVLG